MDTAYARVLDRLAHYANLVGRIEGIIYARDANYTNDFDALLSIRELLALERMELLAMSEQLTAPTHECARDMLNLNQCVYCFRPMTPYVPTITTDGTDQEVEKEQL
jgi:hypothetical protein